jgi:sugar phosphate isomerase/epimerase
MTANRRKVLATLLSAALAPPSASPALSKGSHEIGLQLFTVRDLLEQDFEGTLAGIAGLGYRQVEFAGIVGPSPRQTLSILKRNDLVAPSSHVSFEKLELELPKVLQDANEMEQKFIVCGFLDESRRSSLDDWKRVCRTFNSIGEQAKKAGLGFAYHNHDFEFMAMDGQIPYDVVLAETDPGLVKLEMDLYWMAKAQRDPVSYFQRHPGRFPLVHLKDMARDGTITEVGAGVIDFKHILGYSERAGIACYFVEQDNPAHPMRSIETSLRYLQQLGI